MLELASVAVLVGLVYIYSQLQFVEVMQHECAYLYSHSTFINQLPPGRRLLFGSSFKVRRVDLRESELFLSFKQDQRNLSFELIVSYQVVDPDRACRKSEDLLESLYYTINEQTQNTLQHYQAVDLLDEDSFINELKTELKLQLSRLGVELIALDLIHLQYKNMLNDVLKLNKLNEDVFFVGNKVNHKVKALKWH